MKKYIQNEFPLFSLPTTANNKRNINNHPAIELDKYTTCQVLSYANIENNGSFCIIGNCAKGIAMAKPRSSYIEICNYFEEWSDDYFIILHLSGKFQIDVNLLDLINRTPCLIFCDCVSQALYKSEHNITPKDFMQKMSCLLINSTNDLIDILPTYQYEKNFKLRKPQYLQVTVQYISQKKLRHLCFSNKKC